MKVSNHWVMIRGIVSEEFHWGNFLPLMKERFSGDTVGTADILGNGRHFHLNTPLSVSANIDGLRHQVPGDSKKILLGFSLGGMLALEWAYAHPEEVKGVVLINASLKGSPVYQRLQLTALKKIYQAFRQAELIQRESEILRLTTCRLSEDRILEVAQAWGPRGEEHPSSISNFLFQLFLAARIPQRKSPPSVPVLILNSGKDQVVHPECSARIARKWNLPLMVHAEAGHDLTLDDPSWVLEKLEHWLNGVEVQ